MDKSQQMKSYQQGPTEGNPRQTEAWALSQAALKMTHARDGGDMEELASAVRLNWRLWTIFQSDLLAQDCPLPDDIRGNVISLAAFVDKQTLAFMGDKDAQKVDVLININREIAMGMYQQPQSETTTQQDAEAQDEAPTINLADLEA
ncbi:flagellar biosynthesis regulator FlaF [Terasakiella pusilla]|uniref:flagellar biosynthesis regulator FlaF n=1 Tax=Terasakiella pusilla TaxID=64973 RepID=UPI003AA9477F